MNKLSTIAVLSLMTAVSFSCSGKESETEEPMPGGKPDVVEPTNPEVNPAQDTEDWVYRRNAETGKKEKFFGIGFWGVPGYALKTEPDKDPANEEAFRKWTANSNVMILDPKCLQPYMKDKLLAISGFAWPVYAFSGREPALPTSADRDYYRMQYLKANVDSPAFLKMLDEAVAEYEHRFKDYSHAYAPIDEIALGGLSKWYIPASAGDKINERIKSKASEAVVLVDLLGHGRGSTFFFEKNFLKSHAIMPAKVPYDLLDENARKQTKYPLLGFFKAHDGTPVYSFDAKGNYSYAKIEIETLKSLWFENVKQVAEAYKNNGDVFSINAFSDFSANPILSAVTMDALKAGLGRKPVWLYFDGNGYAKPKNLDPVDYVRLVKCQIYVSLIHGATGILFWNDLHKPSDVFVALQPMLEELQENLPVIKLQTIDKKVAGHLHLLVKQDAEGKKYVIVANTDKSRSVELPFPVSGKKTLTPLEVLVAAL
ncbi:MAG: hypothetical protein PUK70_07625 [Bacteroidales bacterium]|nr:hypothetical protein [Bacteroidales bacterium]MDY6002308.1 hypothetical protein [Candidatus Cryptobacteroides sp.]